MKQFLSFGLLGVALAGVLLLAPISSYATAPVLHCSYACGTQASPQKVQAPVSLGIAPDAVIKEYGFMIYDKDGANVEDSGWISSYFYVTKNIKTVGLYKWIAFVKNAGGESSNAEFYFEVTKVCPTGSICIQNPLQTESFTGVVDRILNIIFFVALAVAPVMILVAGFKFLTGGGNPETLKGARTMLIWTGVGFGIILLSKGIVVILRGVIGF